MTDAASAPAADPAADPMAACEVFYDGACPLCRREIDAYRRMDGMDAVDWKNVAAEDFAAEDLDRDAALARFHVRLESGEIISGARAFLAVWRRNPRLARWVNLLDRRPISDALELAYRGFLKIRPLWR